MLASCLFSGYFIDGGRKKQDNISGNIAVAQYYGIFDLIICTTYGIQHSADTVRKHRTGKKGGTNTFKTFQKLLAILRISSRAGPQMLIQSLDGCSGTGGMRPARALAQGCPGGAAGHQHLSSTPGWVCWGFTGVLLFSCCLHLASQSLRATASWHGLEQPSGCSRLHKGVGQRKTSTINS